MSLEGRLEDLGLPDIFQIISLSRRSGVLTIVRKEGTARLVFSMGQVLYASADNKSRLGYTLVKKGIISNRDLENALKAQQLKGIKKPIGTILSEAGAIDNNTLEKEIRNHILDIVGELMDWESGSFHFMLSEQADSSVALTSGISTEFILLECARLKDEKEREKKVGSDISNQEGTVKKPLETPVIEKESPAKTIQPQMKEETEEAATKPRQERKDLLLLTAMIAEISGPSTSSEITLLILRFASELMNRAVLFLVKKDYVIGLGQFGIVFKEGSADEKIRDVKIPLQDKSVLRDVIEKKTAFKGPIPSGKWNDYLVDQLGGERPAEVFISPLISDGRVIGLLYGDNIPRFEKIGETEGLEAFIKVAGVAFGKVLLERRLLDMRTSEPPTGR